MARNQITVSYKDEDEELAEQISRYLKRLIKKNRPTGRITITIAYKS